MSSEVIIRAENLGKRYFLTHQIRGRSRYTALRDVIAAGAKNLFSARLFRKDLSRQRGKEEFWALREVSFEVRRGEVIGIIGRNGAGKSTLLKILSRITEPTTGRVGLKGRVASLLEVGTGFHPELTGRENIFLNGAILGMTKVEIRKKFDEIVDFAEVEKFLDTPVKHYSSGMYMRLAFAVAAHLEPEILVIDEVLAVGDAAFQKKCLGKMGEVAKQGRTVLFVSHNMASIQKLCNTGIFLESGMISKIADIKTVVTSFLNMNNSLDLASVDLSGYKQRQGSGVIMFERISIYNKDGVLGNKFSIGDSITITLHLKSKVKIRNYRIAVQLYEPDGTAIANMIDCDSNLELKDLDGEEIVSLTLNDVRLYPETYGIGLYLGSANYSEIYDHIERCISFSIINNGALTSRSLTRPAGLLFLTPDWYWKKRGGG